ncbi:hypothetical protein PGB90_010068 [Kerria lacca]
MGFNGSLRSSETGNPVGSVSAENNAGIGTGIGSQNGVITGGSGNSVDDDEHTRNVSSIVIPYDERLATYIVPIVFAIIFLVGVFGNGTLVLIFIRHRVMRNVPNTYILSLALGDLLVIISCVPFTSAIYTFESWPFGELICKISECAKDISIGVSVFTLTALSADRFFAIVDPLKKLHSSIGGRRATKFTIIVTVSIWIFSFLCATPAAAFSYIRILHANNVTQFEACYPFPDEWMPFYARTIVTIKFLVYYAIPLTIIAFFYVLMARHLIRSTRNLPGEAQGQLRQIKARKKVAKTVLVFTIIFAICFLPQHLFMLWFYHHPTAEIDYNEFWHIFRIVGFCLSFINSCINPIALYFISGTFRKYFDEYLFAYCKKNNARRYGSTNERPGDCCGNSGYAGSNRNSIRRGTRKDRTVWESTTTPPALQLSTLRNTDPILGTECTVTTLLNGNETKTHVMI